jgi:hypothetical protein
MVVFEKPNGPKMTLMVPLTTPSSTSSHSVPKAFGLADVVWKTTHNIRLSLADALADEDSAGPALLTSKAQKNGEKRRHPPLHPQRQLSCHVLHPQSPPIVKRFIRLVGANSNKPLCVCPNNALGKI